MLLHDMGVQYDELLLNADVLVDPAAPAVIVTAGAATYLAENLLRGTLVRDPTGGARVDVLPTAALFVAAVAAKYGQARVGMTFACTIINSADAAEAITWTLGAGMTSGVTPGISFTAGIAQGISKTLKFRLTNVTAAAEAIVVYV